MLKTRIITALVLVGALGALLFAAPPWAIVVGFSAIAALAAWEWGGLMRQSPSARVFYALVVLLFCWQIHVAAIRIVPVLVLASAVFWLAIIPLWLRHKWTLAGNDFLAYLIGLLVILPTWAAMTMLQQVGSWLLLAAMALVWVADVAAYFAGRRFGKHKLAPTISPGKTWEGVVGAVIGVLIYGFALLMYSPLGENSLLWSWGGLAAAALLLLLTAVSVMGDLYESLLKRQAGLKDSSALLPGHGGVLDRIDSLTSTLPLAASIMLLLQP